MSDEERARHELTMLKNASTGRMMEMAVEYGAFITMGCGEQVMATVSVNRATSGYGLAYGEKGEPWSRVVRRAFLRGLEQAWGLVPKPDSTEFDAILASGTEDGDG